MKFILDHIFLIAIVVLSGGALLAPMLTQRGKKATPLEVTQLINRGKATIVDVRDAAAFAAGHLPEAKHIPVAELAKRSAELDKFKNRTIVVVCEKGARAPAAASILGKAGFADVVALEGGLAAWQSQGLPLKK